MVKKFVVRIEVENDAFSGEERDAQLASILRRVAYRLEYGGNAYYDERHVLLDSNGNMVGTAGFIEEESDDS